MVDDDVLVMNAAEAEQFAVGCDFAMIKHSLTLV